MGILINKISKLMGSGYLKLSYILKIINKAFLQLASDSI